MISSYTACTGVSAEAVTAAAKRLIKGPLALAAVGDIKLVPRRDAVAAQITK